MNQNGLPTNWMCSTIGELAQVKTGKTPSRTDAKNFGGNIPWVKTAEVSDCIIKETEEHLTEQGMEDSNNDLFPLGSILVALYGQGQTRGRTAMLGIPAATNQACAVLLPSSKANQHYLWWWLRASYVPLRNLGRGGNQPNLNLNIVRNFGIPLPPPTEQRRIVAILDKADAIRRKRKEAVRLTEELLRSTFLEMFGDPTTNPKKWPTVKLGELSSIRRGSSPRPIENYMGGDVPWIKIGDATKGDSFYITETEDHVTRAGAEKSVLLEPGALVIANSGVSLGFARILKIKGCVHDGWLSLENLDRRLNKIYLLRLVNCLTNHFRAIAPDGTQPNLNTGIMKEFRVAIPPIDLQMKFERAAYSIVEMTAARKKAALESESLFDALVRRAFRGEL